MILVGAVNFNEVHVYLKKNQHFSHTRGSAYHHAKKNNQEEQNQSRTFYNNYTL